MTGEFCDIASMLVALKPDEPVYIFRPHELLRTAQFFVSRFPGEVLYTAGANTHPDFLRNLHAGGIKHFAVSGLGELRAVKQHVPQAQLYCLNPVKSVAMIREAAHDAAVTHFAVDHAEELAKIIVHATPLKPAIIVRVALADKQLPNDPNNKFGCSVKEAATLMRAAAAEGMGVGLAFHIGAHCLMVADYRKAIAAVGDVIRAASLEPEIIEIGGGFPVIACQNRMPPLTDYADAVRDGIAQLKLHRPARLLCRPGRALAAAGASLMLKVELRRGNRLHLNDGIHGGLDELRFDNIRPPLRVWRVNGNAALLTDAPDTFTLCGPTIDGADNLKGPFALAGGIRTGDYIEIGQMGAYSINRRGDFGGFLSPAHVIVNDPAF